MLAEPPVFFSEKLGWYVVTRMAEAQAVLSDHERFSSKMFAEPITPLCPAAMDKLQAYNFIPVKTLATIDEPEHQQMRRRVALTAFKPRDIANWEARIRQIYSEYIDRIVKRGHADLVADFFWEAPAIVALEFLGVPKEDVTEVKHYSSGLVNFIFGKPSPEEQVATCDIMGRSQQYARRRYRQLVEDPSGPGLIDAIVRLHLEEPESFDEAFVIGIGVSTLTAAHETTSGSLANGMVLLLNNLSSWAEICNDPALIQSAIEECMRLGPSSTTTRRLCVKEAVIGGVTIPVNAKVLIGTAASNIDPAVFDDPHEFNIHRAKARNHLLFGYGPHVCIGAPLARLQMKVALEELTRRLPHMRLDPTREVTFLATSNTRAAEVLHVVWDPAQNPVLEDRP
jgi:cytochrome P450